MLEAKIIIEAPELSNAITALAQAISDRSGGYSAAATTGRSKRKTSAEKPVPDPIPATATEAPAPIPTAAPSATPEAPATPGTVAPIPDPAPVSTPAPVPAPTAERVYTFEDIQNAGAQLLEMDRQNQSNTKMQQLMELLKGFGVQAVTQLKPEQYADMVAGLKKLGATI